MTDPRPTPASPPRRGPPAARRGSVRAWLASTSVWQRAMLAITLASGLGVVAILLWAIARRR